MNTIEAIKNHQNTLKQDLKSCDLTVVRVQVPFGVQAKSSLS